jgi:hypothetical protein
VFVVGALVEFAIVVILSRRKQLQRKDVERPSILMTKKIRDFGVYARRRIKQENRISNSYKHKVCEEGSYKADNACEGKESILLNNTSVHMIDLIAFSLFIFMYILFNFVYWHQF